VRGTTVRGRYVRRGLRRSDYMRTKTTDEGAPMLDKIGRAYPGGSYLVLP